VVVRVARIEPGEQLVVVAVAVAVGVAAPGIRAERVLLQVREPVAVEVEERVAAQWG
jgi:hypothetical protein